MRYFLGIDVGGTKTHCLVGDEKGTLRGFGAAGCGNYEYHGIESAYRENRLAIDRALDAAGLTLEDIAAVGLGVAGADVPADFEMLETSIYTPLFGDRPRRFKNDSFAALRGGTLKPFGIAVACGTDSVCAGISSQGEEARVGGFGPEFGNRCSARIMGREGLMEVWRAREGIVPPTALTKKFVERAGVTDVDALFDAFYSQRMTFDDLEPMATLVDAAAVDGDAAACAILSEGGRFLAAMIVAVARRLAMTDQRFDVVMAGSAFRIQCAMFIDALKRDVLKVCPKAQCARAVFEPVVGALFMAYDAAGLDTGSLLPVIESSIDDASRRFDIDLRGFTQ